MFKVGDKVKVVKIGHKHDHIGIGLNCDMINSEGEILTIKRRYTHHEENRIAYEVFENPHTWTSDMFEAPNYTIDELDDLVINKRFSPSSDIIKKTLKIK